MASLRSTGQAPAQPCSSRSLLFARLGADRALAIGVASGSRNTSMRWTALGVAADGVLATYFALCMMWTTLLPVLPQAALPLFRAARECPLPGRRRRPTKRARPGGTKQDAQRWLDGPDRSVGPARPADAAPRRGGRAAAAHP